MTNLDTDIDPRQPENLDAIIQWIVEVGDAAESQGLEVKRTLSFASKKERNSSCIKIIKYILASSNRDETKSLRDYKGYGVMIIGVEKGNVQGVDEPPEEHDFRHTARPYFGSATPRFELKVHHYEGKNVLVVLIDPPMNGQPIYICSKNYHPPALTKEEKDRGDSAVRLDDGAVYCRESTETVQANSDQLRAMFDRYKGGKVDATFSIQGSLTAYSADWELEEEYWDRRATDLIDKVHNRRTSKEPYGIVTFNSRPSTEEQISAAQNWRQRWCETLYKRLKMVAPEVTLGLANTGSTVLENPTVELTFPCDIKLLWSDDDYEAEIFKIEPYLPRPRLYSDIADMVPAGFRKIESGEEVSGEKNTILWRPDTLAPGSETHTVNEKIVILVLQKQPVDSLVVRWKITANTLPNPLTGSCELPIYGINSVQETDSAIHYQRRLA